MTNKYTDIINFDKNHVWHPYTSMSNPLPSYVVDTAEGVHINLKSGEKLIDGMSSWWSVLHGYNRPELNNAITSQLSKVAHVMFGGFTHEPAVELVRKLVSLSPEGLDKVFISDSGSVSVEVAMKMAIQYWQSKGQANKHKMMTVRNGYHGDTFAAMSVCDPVTGMHQIFDNVLMKNIFAPAPSIMFDELWHEREMEPLTALFAEHHQELAAFIIEPIVQGTGGMRFYHPNYIKSVRALCDQYNVLFIADEIATGLGRTGKLFACEWAEISPDIMCLGKTLTGGYLSLAATLCSTEIAETISNGEASCFMHGPTFMGNPLACSVANASIDLLLQNDWQSQVKQIETWFKQHLIQLAEHDRVNNIRVLGSIAVVETHQAVNVATIQKHFVEQGVWIRPFGKLIYMMPPLVISEAQITALIKAIATALPHDDYFIE
ncbi:adenosylmethionine--8-amino-7-oxononanoate transaminase [Thalassotalea sediminis]|uniref:adenosylmethionine--8-amino-7-oxononanoate transaminase n=1 Tax=Thalassotalea sediminis TaxID=1759089 RepID=UPI00257478AA|nr:adenosylmethionine--8-amino-7-oxononanoate transaminase [Thalassotalea sediminis]